MPRKNRGWYPGICDLQGRVHKDFRSFTVRRDDAQPARPAMATGSQQDPGIATAFKSFLCGIEQGRAAAGPMQAHVRQGASHPNPRRGAEPDRFCRRHGIHEGTPWRARRLQVQSVFVNVRMKRVLLGEYCCCVEK